MMTILPVMLSRRLCQFGRAWRHLSSLHFLPYSPCSFSSYVKTATIEGIPTMDQVQEHASNILILPDETEKFKSSPSLKKLGKESSQADLPNRRPEYGHSKAFIPLGSDTMTRKRYLTINKAIRFGRLLEDIDFFSGYVCLIHNRDADLPDSEKSCFMFVTALIDRIDIDLSFPSLSPFKDIFYDGRVTWVGQSSMESTVYLKQELEGKMQRFMKATVLYVSLNPETLQPALCCPLDPVTAEDKTLFQQGKDNKTKRKEEATKSVLKIAPSREESLMIHDIFLSSLDRTSGTLQRRIRPEDSVWMEDTVIRSFALCQPTQRNMFNKVHGGFLMRKAFEIAWTTAAVHSTSRHPRCKAVDHMEFRRPVEIGTLLFLSSQVVYNDGPHLQIRVRTKKVDWGQKGSHDITNDCHFTFDCSDVSEANYVVPKVIPKTYADSMLYVDGKRRYHGSFGNASTN